ncbi:MAG: hypothetical protein RLZZ248_2105 [Bacteroidota bacterium]
MKTVVTYFVLMSLVLACQSNETVDEKATFAPLTERETGISFVNQLDYTEEFNVYTFRNFYNGAGIGVGDFNRDGLADLFFAGNQVDNALYLNKGNFEFEEVTHTAGVASENVWTTGVSVADVNGDGWLDIYLCKSGDLNGTNRHNELFINEGYVGEKDGLPLVRFKEQSKVMGLDDIGLATHAAFFDYDLDGDLDVYLLNNSFRSVGNYDLRPDQRNIRDREGGNKLMRNDNGFFIDVSEESGIYGSAIGFGLGVTIGDINRDGWPDIYVSNDFFEKDYLYMNQQNGSFKELSDTYISEMSMGSMGADMADLNNDGWPDLFVTEMLPQTEERLKTKASFENWNKFSMNIQNGYHRQFSRNALQFNLSGSGFSEISRMTGMEATDWSWGALIADFDSDGLKDVFVANGIYKDLLDQDYINIYSNPETVREILFEKKGGIRELVEMIPSEPIPNFMFKNNSTSSFSNVTADWGLATPSFSNGSVYVDLDNDGDLELVVSNINMPPFVFKNQTRETTNRHYLKIQLIDSSQVNFYAIGAKVSLHSSHSIQWLENHPARGFMSSIDARLNFGLGSNTRIDSLVILWPDGTSETVLNPPVDTFLTIFKKEVEASFQQSIVNQPYGETFLEDNSAALDNSFLHQELPYSDFDREPLTYFMHSNLGPSCCKGDVNDDGLIDFYVGGAVGQEGILYIQKAKGGFNALSISKDVLRETIDCVIEDFNNDGKKDLYLANGSSEYGPNNIQQADQLLIQTENLTFEISNQLLPTFNFDFSTSVEAIDFNSDGAQDLLVGTFSKSNVYGIPGNIYVLENDGSGTFTNVTDRVLPQGLDMGMITDIGVGDFNKDGIQDFIAVGEWMRPRIFLGNGRSFVEYANDDLEELTGIWLSTEIADIDQDGDEDILLGNIGENTRFAGAWHLYINDFDRNGKVEQIFGYERESGEIFPFAQRRDLVKQMPYLSKKYPNFSAFAGETLADIFGGDILQESFHLNAVVKSSGWFENDGKGNFKFKKLGKQAQISSVYSFAFDKTSSQLFFGGNQSRIQPEMGSNLGNALSIMSTAKGDIESILHLGPEIGLISEVRKLLCIPTSEGNQLVVARSHDYLKLFKY